MKAVWLGAVLFLILAAVVRFWGLGHNYALSYRASESTTVGISFTTIILRLLLGLAGLMTAVAMVGHTRTGDT